MFANSYLIRISSPEYNWPVFSELWIHWKTNGATVFEYSTKLIPDRQSKNKKFFKKKWL